MAFTDFKSIAQVQQEYNIKYSEESFISYLDLKPSDYFRQEFEFSLKNIDVFTSEASRCENVIYPILREVYKSFVDKYALWSHKSITYDHKLTGTPDYLISTKSELGKTILGLPIVVVVEAKQNNFLKLLNSKYQMLLFPAIDQVKYSRYSDYYFSRRATQTKS